MHFIVSWAVIAWSILIQVMLVRRATWYARWLGKLQLVDITDKCSANDSNYSMKMRNCVEGKSIFARLFFLVFAVYQSASVHFSLPHARNHIINMRFSVFFLFSSTRHDQSHRSKANDNKFRPKVDKKRNLCALAASDGCVGVDRNEARTRMRWTSEKQVFAAVEFSVAAEKCSGVFSGNGIDLFRWENSCVRAAVKITAAGNEMS